MKSKTVPAWSSATRIDDDDGVGAGKAAVDRSNGPDANAQSLRDDNHGVPVLDCLTMTAGRGALQSRALALVMSACLGRVGELPATP